MSLLKVCTFLSIALALVPKESITVSNLVKNGPESRKKRFLKTLEIHPFSTFGIESSILKGVAE